jgi:uncharacterized Zn finger protein
MAVPAMLYCECEICGKTTAHEVVKAKQSERHDAIVVEGVLRCKDCGTIQERRVRQEKPVVLQVVLSEGPDSRRSTMTVDPEEHLAVGDELYVGQDRIIVTGLESTDGKHLDEAIGRERPLVWSKVFNRVNVKVSINRGHSTAAETVDAAPDEEFHIGEIITIRRSKAVIHSIKTAAGTLKDGAAQARAIQRIYAREMRETYR